MKNGTCPKCRSTNVHDGSEIPFKKGSYSQYAIKVTAMTATPLDRYVCTDCGYVEGYVGSRSALKTIAADWPKVRPR